MSYVNTIVARRSISKCARHLMSLDTNLILLDCRSSKIQDIFIKVKSSRSSLWIFLTIPGFYLAHKVQAKSSTIKENQNIFILVNTAVTVLSISAPPSPCCSSPSPPSSGGHYCHCCHHCLVGDGCRRRSCHCALC